MRLRRGNVPLISITRATHRAALAGVGTTGSLVAAVLAVAAVATSVVTFTAWPDAPPRDPAPVLAMQQRAVTAPSQTGGAIALVGRGGLAPLSAAGRDAAAGSRSAASGVRAIPLGGRTAGARVPLRSAGGAAGGEAPRTTPKKDADTSLLPVVDATSKAGDDLGTGVKSGGTAAGDATRKLSPVAGDAVNNVSGTMGEGVAAAGQAVADIVRGLGGRLGGL